MKRKTLKSVSTVVILIFLAVILFFRLGSYPNEFDYSVEHSIHFQVNKIFDNSDVSKDVNWQWKDMHQLEGGRSPISGALVEWGIRLFGFSFLGIRILSVIAAFLALILLYFTMTRYFPKTLSIIFIVLLSTSPWYLTMTRSGGHCWN